MGIQGVTNYLKKTPSLEHNEIFQWHMNKSKHEKLEKSVIVWDCLGDMQRIFRSHTRESKLFADFGSLSNEAKYIIDTFKKCGFELVLFVDGYHCKRKEKEMETRILRRIKERTMNIQLIQQMFDNFMNKSYNENEYLERKLEWCGSSGFSFFLVQALQYHGCRVFRGTANTDADQDIANFVYHNQNRVYGIMSNDSDFFGFTQLPKTIRMIRKFEIRTQRADPYYNGEYRKPEIVSQTLKLKYYLSNEMWNSLGMSKNEQILKLISFVGMDFIEKKKPRQIIEECSVSDETKNNKKVEIESENQLNDEKSQENVNLRFSKLSLSVNSQDFRSNNSNRNDKYQSEHYLLIASKAIISGKIGKHMEIPQIVRDFYKINTNDPFTFSEKNINSTWMEVKYENTFSAGTSYHDCHRYKFTIYQKTAHLRHCIFKSMGLEQIDELYPYFDDDHKLHAYSHQIVNLKEMEEEKIDFCKLKNYDCVSVGNAAINYLKSQKWTTQIQSDALELQLKLKNVLNLKYWPFHREYQDFKRYGVPRTEDFTVRCLYWDVCNLICFDEKNNTPSIWKLFDGPLFHFLCHIGANGDQNRVIRELKSLKSNNNNKRVNTNNNTHSIGDYAVRNQKYSNNKNNKSCQRYGHKRGNGCDSKNWRRK